MPALWEMMVGAAIDSTDPAKAPDFAGAWQKGAALAQQKQALGQKKAELGQQAEELEMKKLEKIGNGFEVYSKMPEGPAKKVYGEKFLPALVAGVKAKTQIHPLNMEMMVKDSGLAGAFVRGVRNGTIDPKLAEDPDAFAAKYPDLAKDASAEQIKALSGDYRETIDKADAERGQREATKTNAEIAAQGMANRAAADDERAGPKKLAEEASKSYDNYMTEGGSAIVKTNYKNLQSAFGDLDKGTIQTGKGLTKWIGGSDFALDISNPEVASARDKIRSAIVGTLRPILGGAFAEKEGQRILDLSFNPRMKSTENAKRVKTEMAKIQQLILNKEKYFVDRKLMRPEDMTFRPKVKGKP